MSYATQADLVALCGELELIQLTDRADPPANAIDAAVLNPALQWASDLADSYISNAYGLPLATTPRMVTDLVIDLARYRLYAGKASEEVQARYDSAVSRLKDIAAGRAKIPGLDGIDPPARSGVVLSASADRLFNHDRMRGF